MSGEEVVKERVTPSKTKLWGASIAWIVVYGALIGVTSLIPIFPYVGGGGFLPLCVVFEAMAPLILGPAGIISAFIGGVIHNACSIPTRLARRIPNWNTTSYYSCLNN